MMQKSHMKCIHNTFNKKISENPYNLANITVVHTGTAAFMWNGATSFK